MFKAEDSSKRHLFVAKNVTLDPQIPESTAEFGLTNFYIGQFQPQAFRAKSDPNIPYKSLFRILRLVHQLQDRAIRASFCHSF